MILLPVRRLAGINVTFSFMLILLDHAVGIFCLLIRIGVLFFYLIQLIVLELLFRRCLKFSYTILASGVAPPKLLYLFKYLFIHNLRIIIGSQVDLVSQ